MNEFSLIQKYFTDCGRSKYQVKLGIGDDAAIVAPDYGSHLVMTMDTLVEGIHFPLSTSPEDIAHKALAVNLSDLAAMGADPAWFLLSLTLPEADESWLEAFSLSLAQQAQQYGIRLIGGDTCRGPLSITVQATGVINEKAILRSGAKQGDAIFVSGELGRAALGLALVQNKISATESESQLFIGALNCPQPRFDVAHLVKQFATSMIDISDGLVADLGHILEQSQCGAELYLEQIPMPELAHRLQDYGYALKGGDDYELCFTLPQHRVSEFQLLCNIQKIGVTNIGLVTGTELKLFNNAVDKQPIDFSQTAGYKHFD